MLQLFKGPINERIKEKISNTRKLSPKPRKKNEPRLTKNGELDKRTKYYANEILPNKLTMKTLPQANKRTKTPQPNQQDNNNSNNNSSYNINNKNSSNNTNSSYSTGSSSSNIKNNNKSSNINICL